MPFVSARGGLNRFSPAFRVVRTVILGGLAVVAFQMVALSDPSLANAADVRPAEKEKLPPPPEEISLTTDDGVELQATYYGPPLSKESKSGKDVVPIILLHGFKGDRQDFDELALLLQHLGHAVIVPDLRGHGESKRQARPGGGTASLDASKLRKDDFLAMGGKGGDLESVKRFLMARNNEGKLNIEKLCVIGADLGATVALNWAALDWSWAQLPGRKQGQDVKALVLISPQFAFKGIPLTEALKVPALQRNLSIMMIVGTGDSQTMRDASRIYKALEKFRPDPPADPKEALAKQDLFFDKPSTSLSGTRMLGEESLKLNTRIARFIDLRLVQKKFPWSDRKSRLNGAE